MDPLESKYGMEVVEVLSEMNNHVILIKNKQENYYILKIFKSENGKKMESYVSHLFKDDKRFQEIYAEEIEYIVYHYDKNYEDTNHMLDYRMAIDISKKLILLVYDLHQKGVVHRDLKPENILYHKETKSLKLIDFESAYVKGDHSFQSKIFGTEKFFDPYAKSKGFDYPFTFEDYKNIEKYTLGLCIYEFLSGKEFIPGTEVAIVEELENLDFLWSNIVKNLIQPNPKYRTELILVLRLLDTQ